MSELDTHDPFHSIHPLRASVPKLEAQHVLNIGKTRLHELLGLGLLDAVKNGTRTEITVESIKRYQASMPPATFKPPGPPRMEHLDQLHGLPDERRRHDRLCELNVIEQVVNVCRTTVVRDAWKRGESLSVHGWIYNLSDGLLRDLGMCVSRDEEIAGCYEAALAGLSRPG